MKKDYSQRGFTHAIVLIFIVVLVIVFAGWKVYKLQRNDTSGSKLSDASSSNDISWPYDGKNWKPSSNPPKSADPLTIPSPVDVSLIKAVLYPGQYRNSDYKAHGGFAFNEQLGSKTIVKIPLDAKVINGSRYFEIGEIQYMFTFITPCGIMYRFDHLRTLSEMFQKFADELPEPKIDDSRTTDFKNPMAVKAGDVVATEVGFVRNNNLSVDFGVYDIRQNNPISQTSAWQNSHPDENEFGAFGICWLDNLPSPDKTVIKSLPGADGKSGKQSDYCK